MSSEYMDDDCGSSEASFTPWVVTWCTSIPGNDWFVEVPSEYMTDTFNLGHFPQQVPCFTDAFDVITDQVEICNFEHKKDRELIERCAEVLYGVIHARYILTHEGMSKMVQKWKDGIFGTCTLVDCDDQKVLPIGTSCLPTDDMVKLYCPKCQQIYKTTKSKHKSIDGAYFGPEFAHVLFLTHPELRPSQKLDKWEPRLFGFRIHEEAYKIQYEKGGIREARLREEARLAEEVEAQRLAEEKEKKKTEKQAKKRAREEAKEVKQAVTQQETGDQEPKQSDQEPKEGGEQKVEIITDDVKNDNTSKEEEITTETKEKNVNNDKKMEVKNDNTLKEEEITTETKEKNVNNDKKMEDDVDQTMEQDIQKASGEGKNEEETPQLHPPEDIQMEDENRDTVKDGMDLDVEGKEQAAKAEAEVEPSESDFEHIKYQKKVVKKVSDWFVKLDANADLIDDIDEANSGSDKPTYDSV